jgi:mycofactocin precursor
MVTPPAQPHTVTSMRRRRRVVIRSRRGRPRRLLMQQDIQADASPTAGGHDLSAGQELGTDDPGITGELLVEEVSIDGMCGVY